MKRENEKERKRIKHTATRYDREKKKSMRSIDQQINRKQDRETVK